MFQDWCRLEFTSLRCQQCHTTTDQAKQARAAKSLHESHSRQQTKQAKAPKQATLLHSLDGLSMRLAARFPAPLCRLKAFRPACTRALAPMPAIKDRIDLTDAEKSIFNVLLQANKQVGKAVSTLQWQGPARKQSWTLCGDL